MFIKRSLRRKNTTANVYHLEEGKSHISSVYKLEVPYEPYSSVQALCRSDTLLPQLHHHIRDLDIFLSCILSRNFKDDVLLMLRNGLLADMLHQLTHPTYQR